MLYGIIIYLIGAVLALYIVGLFDDLNNVENSWMVSFLSWVFIIIILSLILINGIKMIIEKIHINPHNFSNSINGFFIKIYRKCTKKKL